MARIFHLIVLQLFLPLAACSDTLQVNGNSPSPEIKPTGTPLESKPDTQPEAVIVFRRSGGFAGTDEVWKLYSDGSLTLNGKAKDNLSAEQTGQLLSQIEELGFFGIVSTNIPANTCCDRFSYELMVSSEGKNHTVETIDGAVDTPQQFWEILQLVKSQFGQE